MSVTEVKMSQELPQELLELRKTVVDYLTKKVKNKKLASKFEKAVFEDTMKSTSLNEIKTFKYEIFKHRYNYRLEVIVLNIKELEEKITNKEFLPNDIFNKNPSEIFHDKWEESNRRKKEEEKFLYETHLVSNCNTTCFKCREQNVYSTHKQTRSADEPETIFYLCLTCGNKWKT